MGPKRRHRLRPRVLDLLEADGGWLTTAGIHLLIQPDVTERAVQASLVLLESAGLIEHRRVELSIREEGARGTEYRHEWRLR